MDMYKKMEIDKIDNMEKIVYFAEYGSIAGMFLNVNNPSCYAFLAAYILAAVEIKKIKSERKNNETIITFKKIYNDVIDDIIKLSNELENKSLLEHYQLLEYLYNNCYLNYKMEYEIYNSLIMESDLLKETSLNGHGVCRHTSAMCADYLEKLGYDSRIINGYLYTLESLDKNGEDISDVKQELLEILSKMDLDIMGRIKRYIMGNHAICMSNDENYSYYLDITNNNIYTKTEEKKLVGDSYSVFRITKFSNFLDKRKNIESKDEMDRERLKKILLDADQKLISNIDLLEKFNKENKDKLEEAENIYKKLCK